MKTFYERCLPGQTKIVWLEAQTMIVAIDGDVRITYSDASLHWLAGAVPRVTRVIGEGEQYALPERALAELTSAEPAGVTVLIQRLQPRHFVSDTLRRVSLAVRRYAPQRLQRRGSLR